ncbi:HIT domain-containing protein [Gemmatimonas sp.]|uniref:HIT domain-containing protein n=1 Tax=Gemmatimonas sp. TaxID=1962908 RepID=UPI00398368D0
MSDHCIFCRIVGGTIPATLVASNTHGIAFRDQHPQAPSHLVVIPRRHVASLADASDGAELGALLLLAAEVARSEGLSETGYRVVANTGDDAGQTVHHLHLHVLGGRVMHWPPG